MPTDDEESALDRALREHRPMFGPDRDAKDASEDMQAKLLESGVKIELDRYGRRTIQTNEGTVVIGSPQDQSRMQIIRQASERLNRGPYVKRDFPPSVVLDPELDIDWGVHKLDASNAASDAALNAKDDDAVV